MALFYQQPLRAINRFMPTPSEILATNIKRLREDKSLSAKQFALLIETTPNQVSIMESGNHNPTLKKISKYAKALNVTVSELLTHK